MQQPLLDLTAEEDTRPEHLIDQDTVNLEEGDEGEDKSKDEGEESTEEAEEEDKPKDNGN